MHTDADVSLETDRLEQLLEDPSPAPPVVVVHERRRGLPSWLLFPLVFVVPLCSILVYHRLVVIPVNQALEAQRAWDNQHAKAAPASLPTTGPPEALHSVTSGNDTERSPADPSASVSLPPALAGGDPPLAGTKHEPSVPTSPPPASGVPAAADKSVAASATVAPAGAVVAQTDAAKVAGPAANPDPNTPPRPARPALETGFDDKRELRLDDPDPPQVGFKEPGAPGPVAGGVQPDAQKRQLPAAEQPLPTKEENEREFKEEADKKADDFAARLEKRNEGFKAKFAEDRTRFREELADALTRDGTKAGPEIDKIAHRYSSECDGALFARAHDIWMSPHRSQQTTSRVNLLRSIGVPESVILDFMSAELHKAIGSRKGPRDSSGVRVMAAKKLLAIALPDEKPAAQPEVGKVAGPRMP
jgi:hypothetical protein